jgi:hypothetical protein
LGSSVDPGTPESVEQVKIIQKTRVFKENHGVVAEVTPLPAVKAPENLPGLIQPCHEESEKAMSHVPLETPFLKDPFMASWNVDDATWPLVSGGYDAVPARVICAESAARAAVPAMEAQEIVYPMNVYVKDPWAATPPSDSFAKIRVAQFLFVATSVNFHVSEAVTEALAGFFEEQPANAKHATAKRIVFLIVKTTAGLCIFMRSPLIYLKIYPHTQEKQSTHRMMREGVPNKLP